MQIAKPNRFIAKLFINYIVKIRAAKKREVDSEGRVFKKEWITKYFFTEVESTAVCLICQKNIPVAVLKEYNIAAILTSIIQTIIAACQLSNERSLLRDYGQIFGFSKTLFFNRVRFMSQSSRQVFLLAFKIAQASKPFSDGEFIMQCMVETAGFLCTDTKSKYE